MRLLMLHNVHISLRFLKRKSIILEKMLSDHMRKIWFLHTRHSSNVGIALWFSNTWNQESCHIDNTVHYHHQALACKTAGKIIKCYKTIHKNCEHRPQQRFKQPLFKKKLYAGLHSNHEIILCYIEVWILKGSILYELREEIKLFRWKQWLVY